jgi:ketosteroid isomerase-like protein
MEDKLEDRVRVLEDRAKIEELRATYCFLVDDGRFDELADRHFAEDACCDFRAADGSTAPLLSRGREQIRSFFKAVVSTLLRDMCHTVHNNRIAIAGDQASGDCYFEMTATDATSGEAVVGAGRYVDRYRRVGGEWLFGERRAEIWYITPLSEGWARQRFIESWRPLVAQGD